MDQITQAAVNKTIIALCELINKQIKSNSVDSSNDLPKLIEALSKLIHG